MFNLETISANDLHGELKSIEKGEARMELTGQVLGSVQGVITEMNVRARYNFDLQQRRITWVAVAIQENRPVGLGTPGLQVTARLRIAIGPAVPPRYLLPDVIGQLNRDGSAAGSLLEYRSPRQDYVLLLDRHWHVLQEQPQLTTALGGGRAVRRAVHAQIPAVAGRQEAPGAGRFPARNQAGSRDVGRAGDGRARESELVAGLRALKVIVAGRVGEAPIQWIYYHLSHGDGHCLACVFTLSAEEVERFGGEDMTLASSLLFLDEPTEPAAAVEAAASDVLQH